MDIYLRNRGEKTNQRGRERQGAEVRAAAAAFPIAAEPQLWGRSPPLPEKRVVRAQPPRRGKHPRGFPLVPHPTGWGGV